MKRDRTELVSNPITSPSGVGGRLAEQLISLQTMTAAELREAWRRLYRVQPPQRLRQDLLMLAIGWKLQEQALGGLSAATRRRLAAIAASPGDKGGATNAAARRLRPGARLIREWHGKVHSITVLDEGYEWNDKSWPSLSVIAREITGARWSGPRFFGLTASSISRRISEADDA